ncbi:MAG: hypothetical protein ACLGIG_09775 [Actinomycetes bacterium]
MAVTTSPGAEAPGQAGTAVSEVPALADGVELLGEVPGSGYRQVPSLVRRADGQTLQLTPLLYAVLAAVDGERDVAALSEEVSRRTGKLVGVETTRLLLSRLAPLGVLRVDGDEHPPARANPLLALRFKVAVTDPEATRRLTAPFAVLFRTPVVVLVLAAFAAVTWWLLLHEGLAGATAGAFDSPWLMLLVFALTVVSAGFHEFGHAAACRYGGATPGVMGAGLYLVWPAFYTEVGDSYRLGRWGRLRVDLGGLYFNALVAVAVVGVWAVTRFDALLLVVVTQLLQMARQLVPIVRFDGYHVLADLTGVPDLYGRIGPTLRGLLPWNWGKPETRVLRPWARAVVTAWVLAVVPLLLGLLAMAVVLLPRLLATARVGLERQQAVLAQDWADADPAGVAVRLLSMVALVLPLLGLGYLLLRLVSRVVRWVSRWAAGSPVRRSLATTGAVALLALLTWAWWPDGSTYRPISPTERLTVVEMLPTAAQTTATTTVGEGTTGTVTTVWGSAADLPTQEEPALALVLLPRDDDAPAWVFPFDAPAAPGSGDNQALAVGTTDGGTVYDVAFALVWADGDVTSSNEAYAFASCTDCTTVAVAFQVVLVVGESSVAVPQNLAAAVNWSCVECVTHALASQLVLTLPDDLSPEALAELQALWAELEAFGAGIEDVPLDQLAARLEEFKARFAAVVQDEDGAVASDTTDSPVDASDRATPAPTTSGSASGTTASPSPTAEPTAGSNAGTTDKDEDSEPTSSPAPSATAEPSESPTPEPTTSGVRSQPSRRSSCTVTGSVVWPGPNHSVRCGNGIVMPAASSARLMDTATALRTRHRLAMSAGCQ